MIIAIDGPAGSGKSSVSKRLAKELGFTYLDTGAMYRAVTFGALEAKVDLEDSDALVAYAKKIFIQITTFSNGEQKVILDGRDVSKEIRRPDVTREVKHVAKLSGVRRELVKLQKRFGSDRDIVVEGRDTTTVVFPDAELKIYMDASPEERARRRFVELQEKGLSVTYDEVLEDQIIRDKSDMDRADSPLRQAEGAIVLQTDGWSVQDTVDEIIKIYKRSAIGKK